jgi:2-polyprenyl-6-methoxyphenol hydroxylase-like FAD-dependent oxidoreductase
MLTDFGNGERAVRAHIDGHAVVDADVLVAADGAQSPTRRHFLPDLSSTYAGYVAWRGTLDEADAPPDLVRVPRIYPDSGRVALADPDRL